MPSITLAPSRIRFPARCIHCGATPTRSITLEAWRGVDLLYLRWGTGCEIDAPACQRCASRRLRRRIAWFVAVVVTLLLFLGAGAGLAAVVGKRSEAFILAPLIVSSVVYLFYMRSRELELFQRFFSPVWLTRYAPKKDSIEICFRDRALRDDVAALSGEARAAPPPADYRSPGGAPAPAAWTAPPRAGKLPWWLVLGTGLAMLIVGVVEWVQYDRFERTGRSFHDDQFLIWIYELGGKWAVLGVFAAVGALVITFGVLMKIKKKGALELLGDVLARAIASRQ
jgi:hypothetical protein